AETATSYAALILLDSDIAITPQKLRTLIAAAGIEDVEPIWTTLFAKALEGKNVKDLLTTIATARPSKDVGEGEKVKGEPDGGEGKGGEDGEGDGEDGDGDESGSEMGLGLFD
ncbi:hypothetical protein BCR34DRAFT_450348, partial [Clohesyomyces aquaticus]